MPRPLRLGPAPHREGSDTQCHPWVSARGQWLSPSLGKPGWVQRAWPSAQGSSPPPWGSERGPWGPLPWMSLRAPVEQGWEQLRPRPSRRHLRGCPAGPFMRPRGCPGQLVAGGRGHRHIRHPRRLALGHPCREGRACIPEGWPRPSSHHAWRCTCSGTGTGASAGTQGRRAAERQSLSARPPGALGGLQPLGLRSCCRPRVRPGPL